ncbi:hypothetical protein B0H17DRAFT_1218439 [Mycena rosella]|uniref:Uncharacterized protein n=1 Tax=Mycena rosella TaxID=1033263 RepID=A0AAD7BQM3_MYCRO|nr:hypothetical protein B0H17DRAFT_1218439 [Mycena rosella]
MSAPSSPSARRLALHPSALSDAEHALFTTSLADLADTTGDLEHTAVSVREARAWLCGRYAAVGSGTVDEILRLSFFVALRLVLHAQAGRAVDRGLAFVQGAFAYSCYLTGLSASTARPAAPIPPGAPTNPFLPTPAPSPEVRARPQIRHNHQPKPKHTHTHKTRHNHKTLSARPAPVPVYPTSAGPCTTSFALAPPQRRVSAFTFEAAYGPPTLSAPAASASAPSPPLPYLIRTPPSTPAASRLILIPPAHSPFDSIRLPLPLPLTLPLTLPKALRRTLAGAGWVGAERGERKGLVRGGAE